MWSYLHSAIRAAFRRWSWRVATTGSMCEACKSGRNRILEFRDSRLQERVLNPQYFALVEDEAVCLRRRPRRDIEFRREVRRRETCYTKSEMTPSTRGWSSWRQRWPKWGKQSFERPFWRPRGQSKKIKRRMHQQVLWRAVENRERWYSTKIWLHQACLKPLARLALAARPRRFWHWRFGLGLHHIELLSLEVW